MKNIELFDSHAHYYDSRFEREGLDTDALLSSLFSNNVCGIVNVATNLENAREAIAQAVKFPYMYTALGIHPSDIKPDDDIDVCMNLLERMLTDRKNKAVALGEIGLDYHYEGYDKELQEMYFDRQLSLSEKLGIPVSVHTRDAHGDTFETIIRHRHSFGVIHSYSGSTEMALEYVKRGYYISFSGTLTFRNAVKVAETASKIPHDRVLIETDAPYLAPHPHRGEINHSGLMILTAEKLADIWGVTPDEAGAVTAENARRLFFGRNNTV